MLHTKPVVFLWITDRPIKADMRQAPGAESRTVIPEPLGLHLALAVHCQRTACLMSLALRVIYNRVNWRACPGTLRIEQTEFRLHELEN